MTRDEQPNGDQDVHVGDFGIGAMLVLEMGVKMDFGEGLQRQFETAEVFQVTRVDVSLHETGQFLLGIRRRMAFRQHDVRVENGDIPDFRIPTPAEFVVA